MKLKSIFLFICVAYFSISSYANKNVIDSLVSLTRIEQNDSLLIALYNKIGSISNREDEQLSKEYWSKALDLAKEKHSVYFLEQLATAANGLGIISKRSGDLSGAISYYQKSVKINQDLNNINKLGTNYFNIGVIYRNLKEYDKALEYYHKSLKFREEIKDTASVVGSNLAIGVLYRRMGNHEKALEYYSKSLELAMLIDDREMLAHAYSNIGVVHSKNENYKEAMIFFNKGFEYTKTQKKQANIAKYHADMVDVYDGLGGVDKALASGELAYKMYSEMERVSNISAVAKKISELYAKKKNFKKAFEYSQEHIFLKDSIYNQTNTREVTQKEMQFEFDKKNLADSLNRAETEKIIQIEHQQEIKNQKTMMYAGSIILFLVIIFSLIVVNRLKISNKQKAIIAEQKKEVEVKNKEVTDSINYAKRIQSAILPSLLKIKESLPNLFVFYKPKDIVAGDFYWYKKINNKIYVAVADCTGHGVPGAMVSVVCHNALNRAVDDYKLLDPAKILDKTAELVVETFKENNEEGMKDGMDISLCSFDLENKKLEFAGAINSLFFIAGKELKEIKGDKQPIGYFSKMKPFTLHKVNIKTGDRIYMFSDGYADQFGGEKGKKYMYKRFRNLISSISALNFSEQKIELEKEFETWRCDLEQVDDVCVIGIEV
jgi:serine phosphatase RsbU (regulator of sigma subunit)/tetratricopeptide (TPR) repeat protein